MKTEEKTLPFDSYEKDECNTEAEETVAQSANPCPKIKQLKRIGYYAYLVGVAVGSIFFIISAIITMISDASFYNIAYSVLLFTAVALYLFVALPTFINLSSNLFANGERVLDYKELAFASACGLIIHKVGSALNGLDSFYFVGTFFMSLAFLALLATLVVDVIIAMHNKRINAIINLLLGVAYILALNQIIPVFLNELFNAGIVLSIIFLLIDISSLGAVALIYATALHDFWTDGGNVRISWIVGCYVAVIGVVSFITMLITQVAFFSALYTLVFRFGLSALLCFAPMLISNKDATPLVTPLNPLSLFNNQSRWNR
ncbi:MAG: hypothetical protein PHW00_01245 [Clostridia bacterium]|nr:hypothetical protein [Clostridia bacterium]